MKLMTFAEILLTQLLYSMVLSKIMRILKFIIQLNKKYTLITIQKLQVPNWAKHKYKSILYFISILSDFKVRLLWKK